MLTNIVDKIVLFLFSKTPVVKKLDGHKRTIGNLLLVISGILEVVARFFPELPYVSEGMGMIGMIIGYFTRLFGDMHADAKARIDQ